MVGVGGGGVWGDSLEISSPDSGDYYFVFKAVCGPMGHGVKNIIPVLEIIKLYTLACVNNKRFN